MMKLICMKDSFDLIVLGAGSGGLAAAKKSASYGAKVAIVEGDRIGGTCVIRGCVPKKLLVYGAMSAESIRNASDFGFDIKSKSIDIGFLLEKIRIEVQRLSQLHERALIDRSIEIISGWGEFKDENTIVVKGSNADKNQRVLHAKKILIAVGGKPLRPSIDGANKGWISDDMFLLKNFPEKVVIVGAGFIACEFACILNSLGVEVTQLVRSKEVLRGFDREIVSALVKDMKRQGIDLRIEEQPIGIEGEQGNLKVLTNLDNRLNCGGVLFATGRKPLIKELKLENAGIVFSEDKINVDSNNRTNIETIYAIGDVTNNKNLTPVAIAEGRCFAESNFTKTTKTVDYEFIPSAVFSQPEIAGVGLTEEEAISKFGEENITLYRSKFRPMSKSLTKIDCKSILKLIVQKENKKILGCHMIGESSAEIIQMAAISLSMGATKVDFDKTMALHPTSAEEFVTMI